jgi:hypothetical protein
MRKDGVLSCAGRLFHPTHRSSPSVLSAGSSTPPAKKSEQEPIGAAPRTTRSNHSLSSLPPDPIAHSTPTSASVKPTSIAPSVSPASPSAAQRSSSLGRSRFLCASMPSTCSLQARPRALPRWPPRGKTAPAPPSTSVGCPVPSPTSPATTSIAEILPQPTQTGSASLPRNPSSGPAIMIPMCSPATLTLTPSLPSTRTAVRALAQSKPPTPSLAPSLCNSNL